MKQLRLLFVITLFILLFSGTIIIQEKLQCKKDAKWFTQRMSFLPKSGLIKPFTLGFSSTYANYLWIKTMIYFGNHYDTDKNYTWLVTMIDMVTILNPNFYPAYEFAGVILPELCGRVDIARIILNRGINNFGNKRFNIPFYLGWIYYHNYNDNDMASQFLSFAALNPNAPPFYTALAATLYTKAGHKETGLAFLRLAYITTENIAVKKTIEDKIRSLTNDNASTY